MIKYILILLFIIILVLYLLHQSVTLEPFTGDIVIVGLGTAGSVMARRLHDSLPNKKIVVLERGQNMRNDSNVYNLANGLVAAYNPKYSTLLPSDSQYSQVTIASMYGGCSSHNFGLTVHGSPKFYTENWTKELGISYEQLQQYIKRIESYTGKTDDLSTRGTQGPLKVYQLPNSISISSKIFPLLGKEFRTFLNSINTLRNMGPLGASDTFNNTISSAIKEIKGVPFVEDYNGNINACVSNSQQLFVDSVTALRCSTDVAYLPQNYINMDSIGNAKTNDGNLQIVPNATVTQLSDKKVYWVDKNGSLKTTNVNPNGKVILCGGGIYSPYLLQKSGFNNKNIGSNLLNHYGCTMILSAIADDKGDFNFSTSSLAFVPKIKGEDKRDWQIVVVGLPLINKKLLIDNGIDPDAEQLKNPKLRYFAFLTWILNPKTRGSVSFDPNNQMTPKIELNMFEDGDLKDANSDLSNIVSSLKFMYEITKKIQIKYPSVKSVYPPASAFEQNNDNVLIKYVKEGVSMTDHYAGTCAVGKAINPNDFSLMGYPNIHVVDASSFPQIPDGNTEFPTCLIAEIAADRIVKNI